MACIYNNLKVRPLPTRLSETYYVNRNNKATSISFPYLENGNKKREVFNMKAPTDNDLPNLPHAS